jgi:ferric-dicitrate binding protein FerR (iron transport regulator)
MLAIQGKTQICKLRDGQLAYQPQPEAESNSTEIQYNQISTPRGGQYEVLLPDGSRVWLNAASSLRFPTSFSGESRNVSLKGEAYFEVAKNPAMPFKVSVDREEGEPMEVEVLGTHFNIMGYNDEISINTTLIEGAVKVRQGKTTTLLSPFQQAQTNKEGISHVVSDSDVEKAIAWKNGFFDFEDDDISVIMRQLSRWYDVDVHFEGPVSKDHYVGAIRRQSNISKVLDMLQAIGGVRFAVEGKNVTVKAG